MKDVHDLATAQLKRNKVLRPPVPVEQIAKNLGLNVRFAPLDADISGAILRSNQGIVIGVNSAHHPNRQRFSIAHEVGHYLLHEGIRVHIDRDFRVNLRSSESSEGLDRDEIQANRFAAELLMPTAFLEKDVIRLEEIDDAAIQRLAKRYKVSSQAMEIRLANLGLIYRE